MELNPSDVAADARRDQAETLRIAEEEALNGLKDIAILSDRQDATGDELRALLSRAEEGLRAFNKYVRLRSSLARSRARELRAHGGRL